MFLAMFATMTTLIVGSIWNQHRESRAARQENTRQIERATDRLSAEMSEHKQITADNHRSTQGRLDRIDGSLSDARERLARIEGHLRISPQPPKEPETRDTGSDAA